jgi:uncharacterized protein (TIGR00288 family)
VVEERLKIAVFIDFDNIQIGVKDTLGKDFDVSLVLEALKERGEVVTKVAYGDWPRAGDHSRQMTQHAVQMVQRNVTPRGDKNGADINLALDALEMAFTRHHINAFAIVGGDSDFMALVEKLKQYDKRVLVIGGRAFTSNILQRNCTEFIAYENLLKSYASRAPRGGRRGESAARGTSEVRPLSDALPNLQRALKILAEREVSPQIGLLKSTLLQLDSTFSERDYGANSFLEFMQKMEQAGLVHLRRIDRGYLVELAEGGEDAVAAPAGVESESPSDGHEAGAPEAPAAARGRTMTGAEAMGVLQQAMAAVTEKSPNRPLYLRHIRQGLKGIDKDFDERQAGFHGILDFLHQAQREGLLRLQRDRKGVWRVFPAAPGPAPLLGSSESTPVETGLAGPALSEDAADSSGPADGSGPLAAAELPSEPAAVIEEALPEVRSPGLEGAGSDQVKASDEPAAPKARKRPARGGGKTRRATSRRRTKEPPEGSGES